MDDRWTLARTRAGERPTWLAGFGADQPVWVPKSDGAAIYDHVGVEKERLRCSSLPDLDNVLYAVWHLKGDDRDWSDHTVVGIDNTESCWHKLQHEGRIASPRADRAF